MPRSRLAALTGAAVLATSALAATATTATARETVTATSAAPMSYAVLAEPGEDVGALAQRLEDAGATVRSVNTAIGSVSVWPST